MDNPFLFGEVVSGENFADREKEIEELTSDLKSGQNVIIFSPRRYGKTSLIKEVLKQLSIDYITVYCDVYSATSKEKFVEIYTRELAKATSTRLEEALKTIREYIPSIQLKLVFDSSMEMPELEVGLGRTKKELDSHIGSLFDYPQKIAEKKNKRVIVVFDEFQELAKLNGDWLFKELRSKIQHHDKVTYVFMGSKRHLFREIFADKNNPLYHIGKLFPLEKIPKKEFAEFIKDKLKDFEIEEGVIDEILEFTDGHPSYTQQICHTLWEICVKDKKITRTDVERSKDLTIKSLEATYETIWDQLTPNQRATLVAIAIEKPENIYTEDYRIRHKLSSVPTLQTTIKALLKRDLIVRTKDGYDIADPFMAKWLRIYR